ncbi:LptF/LptG family permease [Candidatus Pelagibacter bacterium nBUS_49]|uniref:LptF/LptG family permease n=1 Tax=Candidatus Pelagibacter bacterium nBUS_49 TaxID=3374196 RepID=UPI003EBE5B2D
MKKILFRKLLFDCLIFFSITLVSASIIIWVFQAVNFLDIMVEDGRDYLVYINYSLLNFPKIITRIFPFALFFSFSYVLSKYELNNELMILWNFGINKIQLINFFLIFSFLLMIIQILLTTYLVPKSQNISRQLLKSSNVDFFESFIKPKKFNDNIEGLTIYSDEKDELGNLKNIYLKKETGKGNFQITYSKSGYFKSVGGSKILILNNGETINSINNKLSNFNFTQSELSLAQLDSGIVKVDKIQETSTHNLIDCLERYLNYDFVNKKKISGRKIQNCTIENLDNVYKEIYKRLIIPFYIPVLILISTFLILYSKESINYSRYRLSMFLIGLLTIIFSETTLKFVQNTFVLNIKLIIIPFIILTILYLLILIKTQKNKKFL